MVMSGAITNDADSIFKLIEDWPERFGTPEWRKRAHRELDGPVHEAFIACSNSKKEQSEEESDAEVCPEWELFNSTRTKLNRRKRALESIAGFLDGAAGIAALFFPFWLLEWFSFPFDGAGILLAGHVAIVFSWAIIRLVRWRYSLRERYKLRFTS